MERDEGARAEAEAPRGRDKILCYINMQSPGNRLSLNLTQSRGEDEESLPLTQDPCFLNPTDVCWTFGQFLPADVGLHMSVFSSGRGFPTNVDSVTDARLLEVILLNCRSRFGIINYV